MTTTFEKIRAIIVRDFELPPERLQHDTLLQEIELDSLSITELVFAIEDEFQITAESTIPPFKTLGDIADYVARLIAERDAKPRAAEKAAEGAAAPTPSKRARGDKPASQLAPTPAPAPGGASSEPSKRSHRARKANGKAEKHANGQGRANGASGDDATRAKSARGAKQPTRSASAGPSSKPKRSGGNRAGARIR
jgi:acyl carrier protein